MANRDGRGFSALSESSNNKRQHVRYNSGRSLKPGTSEPSGPSDLSEPKEPRYLPTLIPVRAGNDNSNETQYRYHTVLASDGDYFRSRLNPSNPLPRSMPSPDIENPSGQSNQGNLLKSVSPQLRRFIKIDYNDFESLAAFADREILSIDDTWSRQEIFRVGVAAVEAKEGDLARRCFERVVVLDFLAEQDPATRKKYLMALGKEEDSILRAHMTALDHLQKNALQLLKSSVGTLPGPKNIPIAARSPSSSSFRNSIEGTEDIRNNSNVVDAAIDDDTPRAVLESLPRRPQAEPEYVFSVQDIFGQGKPRLSNPGVLTPSPSEASFSYLLGSDSSLHPSHLAAGYRVRAADFYVPGRVFALLWHESAGSTSSMHPYNRVPPNLSSGPHGERIFSHHGERIFSHIRRVVVIRKLYGHCLCIPIMTYGGRGLKKFLSKTEISQHGIIFDVTKGPQWLHEEPKSSKEAIPVVMAINENLSSFTRIRFDSIFTVRFDIKTKNVGQVQKDKVPIMLRYVQEAVFGDEKDHG